jgi:hypothetical protein
MLFCKQIPRKVLSPLLNNLVCATSSTSFLSVPRSLPPSSLQQRAIAMASLGKIPYVSQDVQEVQTLLHALEGHTKKDSKAGKKPFSCKKSDFGVAGSPENLVVSSWRFQEWDYKRDNLPIYARGLFTAKNERRASPKLLSEDTTSSSMKGRLMLVGGEMSRRTPKAHTN